ncbi:MULTISPECIES: hypothetical protein [Cyanophyceae]|nr:hypothetical protein [Trichocoleus sp. FACHB-69]
MMRVRFSLPAFSVVGGNKRHYFIGSRAIALFSLAQGRVGAIAII